MSNGLNSDNKDYIDRSVQTSPTLQLNMESTDLQHVEATKQDVDAVSSMFDDLDLSEETYDAANLDDDLDELPSMDSTSRSFKRMHLPQRRPSSTSEVQKRTSGRIVSLPETVSEYSEKKTLRKIVKLRVVSMPTKSDKPTPDRLADTPGSDQSVEHIIPDYDRPSRIRVCSNTTDTPRTPSPPSSPDSILIIGSESQISERFLRGSACAEESPCSSETSDDDWTSWTRSPPRPIPALHGPSSLPYARCPSGAEGTVIEGGQDNLPRIIWGLEGGESGHNLSEPPKVPSGTPNPQTTSHSSRKASSRNVQYAVPPRLSQARVSSQPYAEAQPFTPAQTAQTFLVDRGHQVLAFTPGEQHIVPHSDCIIPSHGPIDLNQLARPRPIVGSSPAVQEAVFSNNRAYETAELRVNHTDDLDLDWQTHSLAQTLHRSSMVPPRSSAFSGLGNYVLPSSASVSSLALARSPILFEPASQHSNLPHITRGSFSLLSPPAAPLHTPAVGSNVTGRPSALQIAQTYRQQQLLNQQPNVLPTPPNSSSPLWSSAFSPYQGSLLSPETVTSGPWSSASFAFSPPQIPFQARAIQRPNQQTTLHVRAQGHSTTTTGLDRRGNRHGSDNGLSSDTIDLLLLDPIRTNVSAERRVFQPITQSSVTKLQASPAAPRPPPNTPLQPVVTKNRARRSEMAPNVGLTTPLTPTAPDLSSLHATRQHPRSVPLNRLIRRRLSSVPEEDSGPFLEEGEILSPSKGQDYRYSNSSSLESKPPLQVFSTRGPRFTQKPSTSLSASHDDASENSRKRFTGRAAAAPNCVAQAKPSKTQNVASRHAEGGSAQGAEQPQNQKSRARPRHGKKGRQPNASASNGPERVDGGLTVRS